MSEVLVQRRRARKAHGRHRDRHVTLRLSEHELGLVDWLANATAASRADVIAAAVQTAAGLSVDADEVLAGVPGLDAYSAERVAHGEVDVLKRLAENPVLIEFLQRVGKLNNKPITNQ